MNLIDFHRPEAHMSAVDTRLTVRSLHPLFAGEITGTDLAAPFVPDSALARMPQAAAA